MMNSFFPATPSQHTGANNLHEVFDPLPLFSPTQEAGGENVLHSIFSPPPAAGKCKAGTSVGNASGAASPINSLVSTRGEDNASSIVKLAGKETFEPPGEECLEEDNANVAVSRTSPELPSIPEGKEALAAVPSLESQPNQHVASDAGRNSFSTIINMGTEEEKIASNNPESREFISPVGRIPKSLSIASISKIDAAAPAEGSPTFNSNSSSNLFLSPISVLTEGTKSIAYNPKLSPTDGPTWNDRLALPVEMLDYEFVTNCTSASELERIVAALREESPPKYPSLLRIAKARLRSVVGTSEEGSGDQNSVPAADVAADAKMLKPESFEFASEPASPAVREQTKEPFSRERHISPSAYPGKRVCFAQKISVGTPSSGLAGVAIDCNDDSLCMDISDSLFGSTILDGVPNCTDGLDIAPENVPAASRPVAIESDQRVLGKETSVIAKSHPPLVDGNQNSEITSTQLKDNLATVLAEHSMLQSELDAVVAERDSLKGSLSFQSKRLSDLEGMNEREKAAFVSKVEALEEAKVKAEEDAAFLKETVVTSTEKAREVMSRLDSREKEVSALREKLRLVKEKRQKEIEASSALHDELLAEIEKCTRELASQEKKTAKALRALEARLTHDFEKALSQQRAKADELKVHLGKSRDDVERLTKQKDQLSQSLRALQKERSDADIARRDADRRKSEAAIASSVAAANAMAKALTISERELMAAMERRDNFERQCSELIETNSRLRQDNSALSERIKLLNEELSSSNCYIDSLYEEVNSLKAMKKARSNDEAEKLREKLRSTKEGYQDEIRHLKSQLKESKSWVPVDLYKKAVKEARSNAAALSKKEEEVMKLSSKLKNLEKREINMDTKLFSGKQITSFGKSMRSLREVAAKNKTIVSDEENQTPNVPRHVSPSQSDGHTPPKASPSQDISNVGPPIRGKSLARLKAVRENGGRSGLSAKLKKARGRISPQEYQKSKQNGQAEHFRAY